MDASKLIKAFAHHWFNIYLVNEPQKSSYALSLSLILGTSSINR